MRSVLNLPWSLIGCLAALVSIPSSVRLEQGALIFKVHSWWWAKPFRFFRGIRGTALGNVVLLGPNAEPKDLDHELVHVQQFTRYPIIFPFVNGLELLRNGYKNNRFEVEAYARTENIYKETSGMI